MRVLGARHVQRSGRLHVRGALGGHQVQLRRVGVQAAAWAVPGQRQVPVRGRLRKTRYVRVYVCVCVCITNHHAIVYCGELCQSECLERFQVCSPETNRCECEYNVLQRDGTCGNPADGVG